MSNYLIDKAFKSNVLFNYVAQALKVGLGFAWMAVLTKSAGIGLYGMLALLTSLSGLLTNFTTFRTNEAVVRFYKRGEHEQSLGLCRLALVVGVMLDLTTAALLFWLVHSFADPIATTLLKDPSVNAGVSVYAWVIGITFLRGTGIGLLTAKENFKLINIISVIEQLTKLVLLLVVLQFGVALSLEVVVQIIVVSAAFTTAVLGANVLIEIFGRLRTEIIPITELQSYARFSFSTFISSTLKAGNQNLDTIILGLLTSPSSVGIYSLFRQFLNPLTIAVGPFYEQIYPKFVSAVATNQKDAITHTIGRANETLSRWSLFLLGAIVPIFVLYCWSVNISVSVIHAFAFVLMATNTWVLQQLWWTRGFALSYSPNLSIWANLLFSLLVVSLVYPLTSKLGLLGTATGMLLSALVMRWFWTTVLHRYARSGTFGINADKECT